jgi:predicted nucleic acid-binding Zn ribbon protein
MTNDPSQPPRIQFDPTGASSQAVAGDTCVPNISPKERQLRKKFAIQQFVVALGVLAVLVYLGVNPLWRLLLYFMFSAATTSYIQALDKT